MATSSIIQLHDGNGQVIRNVLTPQSGSTKIVSTGGTSTVYSTATVARIVTTVTSFIAIKSSGTASITDTRIVANLPELFHIPPGSFVALAGSGTAYIDIMQ